MFGRVVVAQLPSFECVPSCHDCCGPVTEFGVKSVSIATLFVKPNRVNIPVTQYFAYEMENDDMLIGYGLSWKINIKISHSYRS
jgi:hypothetical protein